MNKSIELGTRARDRVTGFEGIVTARTEWLNGCIRLLLQPKIGADGKIPESQTFDEPQLETIDAGLREIADARTPTGGPIDNAVPQPQVRR